MGSAEMIYFAEEFPTLISYGIELDGPTGKIKLSDLMSSRKRKSDIEINVRLPDGQTESKFVARGKLKILKRIGFRMTQK